MESVNELMAFKVYELMRDRGCIDTVETWGLGRYLCKLAADEAGMLVNSRDVFQAFCKLVKESPFDSRWLRPPHGDLFATLEEDLVGAENTVKAGPVFVGLVTHGVDEGIGVQAIDMETGELTGDEFWCPICTDAMVLLGRSLLHVHCGFAQNREARSVAERVRTPRAPGAATRSDNTEGQPC